MTKLKFTRLLPLFLLIAITFSSCEAIAGIFKAGLWVGIIGVVIVVAIILWLVGKARK
jgi:hypothetical protein